MNLSNLIRRIVVTPAPSDLRQLMERDLKRSLQWPSLPLRTRLGQILNPLGAVLKILDRIKAKIMAEVDSVYPASIDCANTILEQPAWA